MHLLDVNVLIPLCDTSHAHFSTAQSWFARHAAAGWATCPIVENGVLRIFGNPRYPGRGAGTPEAAAVALRGLIQVVPNHLLIPDDHSLLTTFSSLAPFRAGQLTDAYLLALAVKHRARLVTFDRRIDPALVPGGPRAIEVL